MKCWFTLCPAIDRAEEASWRDTTVKGGQARMQVSIHAKVVGLFLASRATFQPGSSEKRLLER
jgi:hypothetical protein